MLIYVAVSDYYKKGLNKLVYDHLLLGSVPNLKSATCAYWDDICGSVSNDDIIDLLDRLFFETRNQAVLVDLQEQLSAPPRRMSYKTFLQKHIEAPLCNISIYAKAPNELEQIWSPPSYVTLRLCERVRFIGIYSCSVGERGLFSNEEITNVARQFNAGAAYRFYYPLVFSPVAYMNGLSYAPNDRNAGTLTRRDELRVSNYRDHCWRGKRASDGYFRDVYDFVVFNERAASRMVRAATLRDWIASDSRRGSLRRDGELYLWTLGAADRARLQQVLDSERVLLAGFEPD